MNSYTPIALIAYAVVASLSLLLLLWVVYRTLRRLIKFPVSGLSAEVFGADPKVRLVSLGVSTLVFYNVPAAIITLAFGVLYSVFKAVKDTLYANWQGEAARCTAGGSLGDCSAALFFGFVNAWESGLQAAAGYATSFPFASLILFLALWAVTAYMLGETQVMRGEQTVSMLRGQRWFSSAYSRLGWNATLNLLFFLILGLGAYLSIASIIAIPNLQQSAAVSEELRASNLKQRLENALKKIDDFDAEAIPADPDPLATIATLLEEGAGRPPAPRTSTASGEAAQTRPDSEAIVRTAGEAPAAGRTPAPTGAAGDSPAPAADAGDTPDAPPAGRAPERAPARAVVEAIRDQLRHAKQRRQEMLTQWTSLRNQSQSSHRTAMALAVNAYEANLKRPGEGERERREYFLSLTNWFDIRGNYLEWQLRDCQDSLRFEDRSMRSWVEYAERALKSDDVYYDVDYGPGTSSAAGSAICARVNLPDRYQTPPDVSALGGNLGYFRFLGQWLLTTESLSLALIAGLLGFGFLGSACSTFVRERELRKPGADGAVAAAVDAAGVRLLVQDLTGVVVRGMSAAIVVFLAVKGGLAIFASSGSEPNPYVLLLTCFVGSVFSEVVWEKARTKWLELRGPSDEGGGGPAPGDGTKAAAAIKEALGAQAAAGMVGGAKIEVSVAEEKKKTVAGPEVVTTNEASARTEVEITEADPLKAREDPAPGGHAQATAESEAAGEAAPAAAEAPPAPEESAGSGAAQPAGAAASEAGDSAAVEEPGAPGEVAPPGAKDAPTEGSGV